MDPLKNQLQKTYTVELFGDAESREILLKEKPDILKQRVALERKVEELEKAAVALGKRREERGEERGETEKK